MMKVFKGLLCLSFIVMSAMVCSKSPIKGLGLEEGGVYASKASETRLKISHHAGPLGDKITILFQGGEPLFNPLPLKPEEAEDQDSHKIKEYHFFLPNSVVKDTASKKFVQQMNVTTHPHYQVTLERKDLPIPGHLLTVRFDPSQVGFLIHTGNSPKQEASVALTFHDKSRLQLINVQHNTVLQVADLDHASNVKKKYA